MNIWHDISESRITPENFFAVIEVQKNSKMKYEMDKETGLLRLDRVLYTATHYSASYGFIPRTFAEDNDPLDVLVLCAEPIMPLALVQVYPIGAIDMIDEGFADQKIIAIPFGDPTYNCYHSMDALPPHMFKELKHFFTVYKALEEKTITVMNMIDREGAIQIIEEAIARYKSVFGQVRHPQSPR